MAATALILLLPTALAASPDGIVLRTDGELSDLLVELKVPRARSPGTLVSQPMT